MLTLCFEQLAMLLKSHVLHQSIYSSCLKCPVPVSMEFDVDLAKTGHRYWAVQYFWSPFSISFLFTRVLHVEWPLPQKQQENTWYCELQVWFAELLPSGPYPTELALNFKHMCSSTNIKPKFRVLGMRLQPSASCRTLLVFIVTHTQFYHNISCFL